MGQNHLVALVAATLSLTVGAWMLGAATEVEPDAGAVPVVADVATPAPRPAALASLRPPTSPAVAEARVDAPIDASRALASDEALTRRFLDDLNRLRGAEATSALERDPALEWLAQAWAETLADEGELRHSELIYGVVAGDWVTAGENVGVGPDSASVSAGFAASPGHRANVVDPDFTHVGVGVVVRDGAVWTAHLFAG